MNIILNIEQEYISDLDLLIYFINLLKLCGSKKNRLFMKCK